MGAIRRDMAVAMALMNRIDCNVARFVTEMRSGDFEERR